MSNEERVKKLEKRIGVDLDYSSNITMRKTIKPNKSKLQNLASKIRKEIEETSVENSVHSGLAH